MFSIGDFARHGRVSVRMLRHYDAIGLLRPARVDAATGYRYYHARQLADLNRLVVLKDLGFTLEQVRSMLHERVSGDELRGMLRLRRAELAAQISADTLVHQGPMDDVMPDYEALARWVGANDWVAAGSARELYLAAGPDCVAEATELQQPVVRG